MKRLNRHVAIALGLVLCGAPALAQEADPGPFVAISEIETLDHETPLSPLPDSNLESIEGTGLCFGCPSISFNIVVAPITQLNIINQVAFAIGRNITQISGATAVNTVGGLVRRR
jgi:hypothetical protein